MAYSGTFSAHALGADWAGYEDLAQLCESAVLTNRQARVVLLWYRGFGPVAIGQLLGCKRTEVWRSLRQANRHVSDAYPQVKEWMVLIRSQAHTENREIWETFRDLCRGSGRGTGPRMRSTKARVVSPEDLGLVYITPLDLLPVLLEDLRRKAETRQAA